jgi:hypothetical protein
MINERDYEYLMGQVAGMIAVMSAVVQALPPSTRTRVQKQMHAQFESLIEAMCTTGSAEGLPACEGAEWVRDLFLKRIARAEKKSKIRETPPPAENGLDVQL